jgi:dTDP-glucose 4,6-dehydratase
MTILVTGGAGFIGSCFVRAWLAGAQASRVVVLDKLTYAGSVENLAEYRADSRLLFVQGSIEDQTLVGELLQQHRPRRVVNFAAESHVDRSIDDPLAFVTTNVMGTCRLLEACLEFWHRQEADASKSFRYLHVSTDEVFGELGSEGIFDESSRYAPNSPYAASKAAADHFVRAYHKTYGLPTIITNCTNNYGPYQYPEKLIPLMIRRAMTGRSLPVYGRGDQVRDWLHVEDHCLGIRKALSLGKPGQVYLFGGNSERTNLQVVEAICGILDAVSPMPEGGSYQSRVEFVKDRPGHDYRYAADTSNLRAQLDWQPMTSFEQGLRDTVNWYVSNQSWIERVLARSPDATRLGLRSAE